MSDQAGSRRQARRQILKRLAMGGAAAGAAAALPPRWVTPLVHSVSAPLHAQVSPPSVNPESLAGSWTGVWVDSVAGLNGTASMTISVDPGPRTFVLVLDLNGPVLGAFDPIPQTFIGSYTDAGGTFGFQVIPRFGVPVITVSPAGAITGLLAPLPEIGTVQFTGVVTASTLTINYTATAVYLPYGGTLTLSK